MFRACPPSSKLACLCGPAVVALLAVTGPAAAHNPIFTPGPHLVYGGGIEATITYVRDRASGDGRRETGQEAEIEVEYGITADLTAEIGLSYLVKDADGQSASGLGDIVLRSRYRFLRLSTPGVQRSAAILAQIKLPTGDHDSTPRLGSGSTDFVGGLLWGHESRRWYYNLAARYRRNTEGEGGLRKGDRHLLDLAGGVRLALTGYLEPDAVVFLEFNWENAGHDELNGVGLADTGGWELFLSPGLFATYRNIAFRTGIQIPLVRNLNGRQPASSYRFKAQLKYTF